MAPPVNPLDKPLAKQPKSQASRPSLTFLAEEAFIHREIFVLADCSLKAAKGQPEYLAEYRRNSNWGLPSLTINNRQPSVKELEALTHTAMMSYMYKFMRYQLRVFATDARKALGQESLSVYDSDAEDDDDDGNAGGKDIRTGKKGSKKNKKPRSADRWRGKNKYPL